MTREDFDERINKTLVSMGVYHYTAQDNHEQWDHLFEFYSEVPEEALEILMMDAIDEHRRGDGAMLN